MAIKINIGTLNEGGQQIALKSGFSELGLDENLLKGPVNILLDLYKTVHQLDLKVKVTGILMLECDRCLDAFEKNFEAEFELIFVQKNSREEEINEDNIRTYNPFMKSVDITSDIKELIILTMPMKKLPDEKPDGSCSWCGKTKEYWKSLIIEKDEDDF
jgi:uncharacterized metal-binding protein YceD (DUF177 family)